MRSIIEFFKLLFTLPAVIAAYREGDEDEQTKIRDAVSSTTEVRNRDGFQHCTHRSSGAVRRKPDNFQTQGQRREEE
jgi:hypothetical protein